MFDFSPLTTNHFFLFLSAFAATFWGIGYLTKRKMLREKLVQDRQVYYAGSALLVLTIAFFVSHLTDNSALVIGLAGAGVVVLLFGLADEELNLSPRLQLIGQMLAATLVVLGGWRIQFISNPFSSGTISFSVALGGLLTIVWLILLINAVNWLDGIDAAATSVGFVAFVSLALISLLPSTQDARTLPLALIGAGCLLGFLLLNAPPAKIYLGTVGSWWLGLLIGIVAIVGGGKVITTLLVLAIPVIDAGWVIFHRLLAGQKPWDKDQEHHLHHRLMAAGFSARRVAALYLVLTIFLAAAAILLQTKAKIILFVILVLTLGVIALMLPLWKQEKRSVS